MHLESCNVMLQAPELRHRSISMHGPKLCTSTWTSAPPQGAVSGGRASPAWVWARAKGGDCPEDHSTARGLISFVATASPMPWRRAGGCPAWWLQPSSPWLWAMEDEEGYTMLKFGAKRSAPRRQQGGGMAAAISCSSVVPSWGRMETPCSPHPLCPMTQLGCEGGHDPSSSYPTGSSRCQYLVASAGWALSTGLAIAVITLGLRVWQLHGSGQCYVTLNTSATDAENWENGCRGCLERFQLQLKTALCNAPEMDGRGCRLCPRDWLQHGNWCYWVSHESRDWQRSRDDCAQKGSALFIIRNREQMQVLQDVTQGRGYVWIGLAVTGAKGTWTWLDGSVLDTKQFHVLGSATSGSCALIKDSQIRSEGCNAESRWVCEKDAVAL
ncbi:C-type lectin domain family 9 member A-like isoform X1 [Anas acuta]|uniref:C-type lectin domain family 9 member A-like isoform X1 n=1 Tax=Anas acuta TaxID=28680 RepID=UPI0035C8A525